MPWLFSPSTALVFIVRLAAVVSKCVALQANKMYCKAIDKSFPLVRGRLILTQTLNIAIAKPNQVMYYCLSITLSVTSLSPLHSPRDEDVEAHRMVERNPA